METTKRGISQHLKGRRLTDFTVRNPNLRWPVQLPDGLCKQKLHEIGRRGKYLLFGFDSGTMIVHLGMSGSLRVIDAGVQVQKHDHIDWIFECGRVLRYTDPRRFGSIHWCFDDPKQHKLLKSLGPEPLDVEFDEHYLYRVSRGRKTPIKTLLMNSKVVVGVGNIYANESLFLARVNPSTVAGSISRVRLRRIVNAVKEILEDAIAQGGTTLRDFVSSDGKPGYFTQALRVYGRAGEACLICKTKLKGIVIGQRQTVFCPKCQRR